MTFEEAFDMAVLYSISPELTCTCDELHMCQQCYEESKEDLQLKAGIKQHTPNEEAIKVASKLISIEKD